MNKVFFVLFISLLSTSVYSQNDTTFVQTTQFEVHYLFDNFGNCYFSIPYYRKDGSLKKEIRSNGNGHLLIMKYNRSGEIKSTKRKYNENWVRNQAPPCYN